MEWLIEFWDWAWARHANPLSWYIRPLFLIPFIYYSYRRSWRGIAVTLLALASSMFWFPAPENPDPQVLSFLEAEQEFLTGGWTPAKAAFSALVPVSLWALSAAFWRRSLGWGLVVINGIALAKTVWSLVLDEGGAAVIVPALVGLVLTNAAVIGAVRWRRRGQHGQIEETLVGSREPAGLR